LPARLSFYFPFLFPHPSQRVVVQQHHQAEGDPEQLAPASQQAERHRQRSP
jgi:hypothetical protein